MKISTEVIDSIRRGITVDVSAETAAKAFDEAVRKIGSEASLPGFRKGKVPAEMLLQRFAEEIQKEAVKEAVYATMTNAVKEAGLAPLSEPHVTPHSRLEKGKPFSYKLIIEVYPEVKISKYDGLKLTRPAVTVEDEEVEQELKRLQMQLTQLEPAAEHEAVGPGMVAMIDFNGTAAGKKFTGSDAENYVVDFGAGGLLKDFEAQIEGMKAGEERNLSFDYPADFYNREIAGKRGEFRVKVKEIRRKVVPALDDEFAKGLGEFADLNSVRKDLKERILAYRNAMADSALREQAIRNLIAEHQDIEVPTALIDAELKNMLDQLRKQLEDSGKTIQDAKIDAHNFVQQNVKEATDRARGYMLIREIGNKENIAVADEELNARIEHMATNSRSTPEQVREYLQKNNMIEGLRAQMLFEKTLDLVVSKAKIEQEKPKKG